MPAVQKTKTEEMVSPTTAKNGCFAYFFNSTKSKIFEPIVFEFIFRLKKNLQLTWEIAKNLRKFAIEPEF